jgi:gas vesicle protein
MNEMNRPNGTLIPNEALMGFLAGAALGAGVALLLAPAKGADTRRKIRDTTRRLGNGVHDQIERMRYAIGSHTSDLKEDVNGAMDRGRAAISKR